jgi:hypothetical protein
MFCPYRAQPPQGSGWLLTTNHGFLCNTALEERLEAWRTRKPSICSGSDSAEFRQTRARNRGGQGRHLFAAQWPTRRRVDVVFEVFCDRRPALGQVARAVVRRGLEPAGQAAS